MRLEPYPNIREDRQKLKAKYKSKGVMIGFVVKSWGYTTTNINMYIFRERAPADLVDRMQKAIKD